MKLTFDRTESNTCKQVNPKSVSIKVIPDPKSTDWSVEVESCIQKKSAISALLMSVAKLMPHLSPRRTDAESQTKMRKLMTASINNKALMDLIPLEGEVQHALRLKREGNRVHVTVSATADADTVQATWNTVAPILTPRLKGKEDDPTICVVADS